MEVIFEYYTYTYSLNYQFKKQTNMNMHDTLYDVNNMETFPWKSVNKKIESHLLSTDLRNLLDKNATVHFQMRNTWISPSRTNPFIYLQLQS